jgi:hypothetical protein
MNVALDRFPSLPGRLLGQPRLDCFKEIIINDGVMLTLINRPAMADAAGIDWIRQDSCASSRSSFVTMTISPSRSGAPVDTISTHPVFADLVHHR